MRIARFPFICALLLVAGCVQGPDGAIINALDVCVDSTDGALCDDQQPCTIDDACINHVCTGTVVADGRACTDGNGCTGPDRCQSGVCVGAPLADGTACTDDNACTDPDLCRQGICQPGGPRVCDDGDSCTIDTCVPASGCVFSPRECTLPPDAALDRPNEVRPDLAPDLPPDLSPDLSPDLGLDLAPPDGPDAISEGGPPDRPEPDTGVLDTGIDLGVLDAVPPDGGADAALDVGTDGPADAGPDSASGRDGSVDLSETPPDLRVRGGGCQCGLTAAPAPAWPLVVMGLAAATLLALRRGRRPGPGPRKKI